VGWDRYEDARRRRMLRRGVEIRRQHVGSRGAHDRRLLKALALALVLMALQIGLGGVMFR
jgi:hypothetical protein